jgi:hypothetical protein
MPHHGSCHCGNVTFEFESVIDGAASCNCSICSRKGALLFAVAEGEFKLLTPPDQTSTYTFNNHSIVHRFCKTCGMQPYAEHAERKSIYVNLRCVDDIDLSSVPVVDFDGKSVYLLPVQ